MRVCRSKPLDKADASKSFHPDVPPPQSQQQVHDFMGWSPTVLISDAQARQRRGWIVPTTSRRSLRVTGELKGRRYAWFGAVRDGANLHGVHSFNRLMDERGDLTPL